VGNAFIDETWRPTTFEGATPLSTVFVGDGAFIFPGAVIGRPPMGVKSMRIQPSARYSDVTIGRGSVIGANVVIYAGVDIGDRVLIGDGVTIREDTVIADDAVIGSNSTIQNDVSIGERSRIADLSHVTAGVVIGDDVFWSVGVLSMNDNSMSVKGDLEPPSVGNSAKIGGGALLLPGVSIGADSTVAAGSVVTHDVPNGERVRGIPAKSWPKEVGLSARAAAEDYHRYLEEV